MEKNTKEKTSKVVLTGIMSIEFLLFVSILLFLVVPLISQVYAVVGANNVTVTTLLQVGNVFPQVTKITTVPNPITLTPNATTNLEVVAVIKDFNGEADIVNVTAVIFNKATSTFGASDDLNRHYTNESCILNTSYGTIYETNASCIFPIQYFAEPGTWNITVYAYTNASLKDQNSSNATVNSLIALGLPDSINYGTVNATEVSAEQIANVTNFGNVMMNLSLKGYAVTPGDNLSMNCSLGITQNISINYEKYNLTLSNAGQIDLTQFQANYTNLTSTTAVVKTFNLAYRQNDGAPYTDDTNSTYWRMYVPLGVAGSCRGNIVFGAVQSAGS